MAARIQQLKEEREFAAQAAVMPAPAVLEILKNSGIERLIDFFERDAAGNFHVADFQKPPIKIASSIPAGGLVKSANSEDHLATTAMKFLGDLRAGRAAAYNQCSTSRQLRRVSIVARVYLKDVGWQFANSAQESWEPETVQLRPLRFSPE